MAVARLGSISLDAASATRPVTEPTQPDRYLVLIDPAKINDPAKME